MGPAVAHQLTALQHAASSPGTEIRACPLRWQADSYLLRPSEVLHARFCFQMDTSDSREKTFQEVAFHGSL